ncbi:MAG: bifunctional phosphopantothenoylcysteine decarboxylase/phosphopantothenate--cysteine ligase CoaBC [Magnetococcales bacterium]|nr:bifunctional phosphopantothenoylcysteine decarboxylase/phosphopantothenate--cysteine ligase CoaBC [Magnetococcales bacterium]
MQFWLNKEIALVVGGGIAACRILDLIRGLKSQGAGVSVIGTPAATRFVTPLTFQAISGRPFHGDLFDPTLEGGMDHIRLAREADLVIIAPATADLMAKMAHGLANDLASAMLLARKGPILAAPAMNVAMWEHPATQRNVATLARDGVFFCGPDSGSLACGEEGAGRLATVDTIIETARRLLEAKPLAGRQILLTAGPTREEIDPVRYVSNHSSGRMGWGIALAALRAGARVTLVHGPVHLPPPLGAQTIAVTSAREMYTAVIDLWEQHHASQTLDAAIMTAAVADFRPVARSPEKIKKNGSSSLSLELEANPDILLELGKRRLAANPDRRQPVIVGFAAETGAALKRGREKMARKKCDLLVINDLLEEGAGFGVATNRVTVLNHLGQEEVWPLMSKDAVGARLIQTITTLLTTPVNGGVT